MAHFSKNLLGSGISLFCFSLAVWQLAHAAAVPSALVITSPPNGSVFEPGQTVNLTVEPQGAIPEAVAVISPLGTDIKTQPPFTLSITIPVKEPLGVKRLTAVARGRSDNESIQAAIDVNVETATPIASVRVDPSDLFLGRLLDDRLAVYGTFADGQTRIITKSREIRYASSNPQVATVAPDGLVKAVGEGTATITVTYKDKSATVPVKVEFARQSIKIDIVPGTFPNAIDLDSQGVVTVAILTTQFFDPTKVDPLSVRFGPNGAIEVHGRGHFEDMNGDGFSDMVLHFSVQEAGIQCLQKQAVLTGSTVDGVLIRGVDSIAPRGSNCIQLLQR